MYIKCIKVYILTKYLIKYLNDWEYEWLETRVTIRQHRNPQVQTIYVLPVIH